MYFDANKRHAAFGSLLEEALSPGFFGGFRDEEERREKDDDDFDDDESAFFTNS